MEITLVQPLSTRVTRIAQITSLVLLVGILALLLTILFASLAAHRFAKPVRLLSETASRIGDGDLSARVPTGSEVAANVEMEALLSQFNRMAGRLEGTVAALRRERDRGQEHLADVSHELRTPLAALREFGGAALAHHKLPDDLVLADALPLTVATKLDRSALRTLVAGNAPTDETLQHPGRPADGSV